MRRRDQELLPPHRLPRKPLVVGGRDDGKARDSYAWSQDDDKFDTKHCNKTYVLALQNRPSDFESG